MSSNTEHFLLTKSEKSSQMKSRTHGRKVNNLAGRKFGRLTVLDWAGTTDDGHAKWRCSCVCGNIKITRGTYLVSGSAVSCGCFAIESARASMLALRDRQNKERHFRPKHLRKTYTAWLDMIRRCTDCKNQSYHLYGGRGITVCAEWLKFENFLRDMGESKPGLSLERTNNDVGYSKNNCVWATQKVQARNTRRNRKITFQNKTLCMSEWEELLGIKNLYGRLKYGWSVEAALTTPPLSRYQSGIRAATARGEI